MGWALHSFAIHFGRFGLERCGVSEGRAVCISIERRVWRVEIVVGLLTATDVDDGTSCC